MSKALWNVSLLSQFFGIPRLSSLYRNDKDYPLPQLTEFVEILHHCEHSLRACYNYHSLITVNYTNHTIVALLGISC